MTPLSSHDTARLLQVLGGMCDLLRAHGRHDWADALSDIGARQADEDVRGDILRLYGGAGSLNDLVLHSDDRARRRADNDQFEAFRSELYALARSGLAP
jgi:hypothetical protein